MSNCDDLLAELRADPDAFCRKYSGNKQELAVRCVWGESLLHYCAVEGWADCVEALIRCGLDVNGPDEYGSTPLMGAALNGHFSVVEILLRAGADPDLRNGKGDTVYDELELLGSTEMLALIRKDQLRKKPLKVVDELEERKAPAVAGGEKRVTNFVRITEFPRFVQSVWNGYASPTVVAEEADPASEALARALRSKRFDEVDFADPALALDSVFLVCTPEAVSYYLASYLLRAGDFLRDEPERLCMDLPSFYLHDFLRMEERIFEPVWRFIVESRPAILRVVSLYLELTASICGAEDFDATELKALAETWGDAEIFLARLGRVGR